MPRSQSEFTSEVLALLGILGPGETPSAEDSQRVEAVKTAAFATLGRLGAYDQSPSDDVEDGIFYPLATYVSLLASPRYSIPLDPKMVLEAERQIRRAAAFAAKPQTLSAEYF